MATFKLPFFGKIDVDALEDYYEVQIEFEGKTIELDLDFEQTTIAGSRLQAVNSFLENLAEIEKVARKSISEDFNSGEVVKQYIQFHLDQLDKTTINQLLKNADKNLTREEQMFSGIYLTRIGFFPEDDDSFATFDYTIGSNLTDHLIAIVFNIQREINYITIES